MKVILIKDVDRLGQEGKVVNVKDGYARNCLIPQGLALKADEVNSKQLDELKRKKDKALEKKKEAAMEFKKTIEAVCLTIPAEVKEDEEIFGSINEAQILKMLSDEGISLDKGVLEIADPIKKLGVYNLKAKIHPEVEAAVRVWVVKK